MTIKDYRDILSTYRTRGWITTPLPHAQKGAPHPGITGSLENIGSLEKAAETSKKAWETRLAEAESTEAWPNLGARTPDGHISLDIDSYEGKDGIDTIRDLEEQLDCPLPSTYMNTRRGEPLKSAHWIYKVPADAKLPGDLGKTSGVEILKPGHRYSVAFPSVIANDKGEADQYLWYRLNDEGEVVECDIPDLTNNDIPELPQAWLDYLSTLHIDRGDRGELDLDEAWEWLEENTPEPYGEGMRYPEYQRGDGHETWLGATLLHILNKAVRGGERGAITTINTVLDWYRHSDEMLSHRGSASKRDREAKQNLTNAVAQVKAEVDQGKYEPAVHLSNKVAGFMDSLPEDDYEEGTGKESTLEEVRSSKIEALEKDYPGFWESHPYLSEIEEIAEKGALEKYSLLFRSMSYLSAELPPQTYLEDPEMPLTIFSVQIAPTGAGKGNTDKAAQKLIGNYQLEGEYVIEAGDGNIHTLLTKLGDFSQDGVAARIDKEKAKRANQAKAKAKQKKASEASQIDAGTGMTISFPGQGPDLSEEIEDPLKPRRMMIATNEMSAWVEQQSNAGWSTILANVYDGEMGYDVREETHSYHFGLDQHSLGMAFSVQPEHAHYFFGESGGGFPGRSLTSVVPEMENTLSEGFNPLDPSTWGEWEPSGWTIDSNVKQLQIDRKYLTNTEPFYLTPEAHKVNEAFKAAWDNGAAPFDKWKAEKIFSQTGKTRVRVAALLTVLLDLAPDADKREVPLEALVWADFLVRVSVANAYYAQGLTKSTVRKKSMEAVAEKKVADIDSDLQVAKEQVVEFLSKKPGTRAGIKRLQDRKKKIADFIEDAVAELVAEGVLIEHAGARGPSYSVA